MLPSGDIVKFNFLQLLGHAVSSFAAFQLILLFKFIQARFHSVLGFDGAGVVLLKLPVDVRVTEDVLVLLKLCVDVRVTEDLVKCLESLHTPP